jgi:ATP-dependent Clp protease adaptor protein ClpS
MPLAMVLRLDPSGYASTASSGAAGVWMERAAGLRLGPDEGGRDRGGAGTRDGSDAGTITRTKPKTKRPSLYRVLLLNDDYTPMEFVVLVLQDVFNKSREDAMRIMLHVHNHGVGECGIYPFEVAETKVTRVMDTARKNQHPLQCVMEKQ